MGKNVEISGIPIDNLSYDEVLDRIDRIMGGKNRAYIATVNPEMILRASRDKEFSEVLKNAEIRTPDGIGILWAAYYLSLPKPKRRIKRFFQFFTSLAYVLLAPGRIRKALKERITGADLFPKIIDYSQEKGWRIFLLGASEGVGKKVIEKFIKLYPKAKFSGCFAGSPDPASEKEIYDLISQSYPDLIFVAYGSPDQELWIHRNLPRLNTVKIAIGVGGAFDFYAGRIKRAPKFMQKIGLEWLWRFLREPRRIVRIWNATVMFMRLIVKEKMGR